MYFVGVDVGTGSVRAALVDGTGRILKKSTNAIQTWNPEENFYQQSSEDIWRSCCKVVREVTEGVSSEAVGGIGFDATCSLVVVDSDGLPLSVSKNGEREQNVILWMDHRAKKEADLINTTNHRVLKYVGGKISLEMETPKILWLKNNLPKNTFWQKVGRFFDLPDFLTWKATDAVSRSLCTVVCKWTYCADQALGSGWDRSYFEEIGLDDLSQNNWSAIGNEIFEPGRPCGSGLTDNAAREMGLTVGTPVATSLIDAHAGGLGMIGIGSKNPTEFKHRLVMIGGTSTCHMLLSDQEVFVDGVWGPYYGAIVPDLWLLEGGQSATGKLIDHVINTHPAAKHLNVTEDVRAEDYLNGLLVKMAADRGLDAIDRLTEEFHVYPDFHGNRSPVADPTLKGMVVGLTLSVDQENLALIYLATIQALCYGTRHIIGSMEKKSGGSLNVQEILVCGGLCRNRTFLQCQANVAALPVRTSTEDDSVLIGSAMLAAAAWTSSKSSAELRPWSSSLGDAITAMASDARTLHPSLDLQEYHRRKYGVYLEMLKHQNMYKNIMSRNP
ncbi:FGGY carbohydrate kinase domain-containing protein isoform X2 [Acyrthosiphon pisum]|nr:FGGY carbohydrate kinase domain-containing protein isoform X2 [Acyrthosiphon pisum]XP_029346774.1 FGGY carbohydrate kinase domain-containing protein isoform X2 [Acyrthosiphon pisum]|eukprot:XP_001947087.2 PREDICTED: FGGY carbohydrate kinase domain-containing protein-like isoform X3 [Acyrthosiphon pisum]